MARKVTNTALATLLLLYWLNLATAWGQSDQTKILIEGAKKEGKLLWYTALNINDGDMLLQRFQNKYPFIKVEMLRLGSTQLLTKVLTEARLGAFKGDVIEIAGVLGHILKKSGLLEKYISSEATAYPSSMKDSDGTWTSFFIQYTHPCIQHQTR